VTILAQDTASNMKRGKFLQGLESVKVLFKRSPTGGVLVRTED